MLVQIHSNKAHTHLKNLSLHEFIKAWLFQLCVIDLLVLSLSVTFLHSTWACSVILCHGHNLETLMSDFSRLLVPS